MTIAELNQIIQSAGGQCHALDYANDLLKKLNGLHPPSAYLALCKQLNAAKDMGDFRGRVLEVNFASRFIENNISLQYGAKQGRSGDIDFCWNLNCDQIFIEMKLLGQDMKTKLNEAEQLNLTGCFKSTIEDDTRDIGRIQRDIIGKSSTRKFDPKPSNNIINIVAIDVSELQLGMVDIHDCLLAVGGNRLVSEACKHRSVVGIFENLKVPTNEQREWISCYHSTTGEDPHPQTYIHGVLFLFRQPAELAALSYKLSAAFVWNSELIDETKAKSLSDSFHKIVPSVN